MESMLFGNRGLLFSSILVLVVVVPSAARPADIESQLVAKTKMQVQTAVKKGEGDFYAVLLIKSTFCEGKVRRKKIRATKSGDGTVSIPIDDLLVDSGKYCPEEQFKVIEGAEEVVESVVTHMTPLLSAPPKKKTKKSLAPPPPAIGEWKLIGRYTDQEQAEAAIARAKAIYESEPHWAPAAQK